MYESDISELISRPFSSSFSWKSLLISKFKYKLLAPHKDYSVPDNLFSKQCYQKLKF